MPGGLGGLASAGNVLPGYNSEYEASLKQMGDAAFGRTLQMLNQQQQPQPPQPQGWGGQQQGQAPMPGAPPNSQMPPPPVPQQPPQGQPGMMPPGQMPQQRPPMAPPQGGGQQPGMPQQLTGGQMPRPQLDWRTVLQKVGQANPGVPPQVLAAAVDRFLPLMNSVSQQEWREVGLQLRGMQVQQGQERVNQGQERVEQGQERIRQGEERVGQAEAKETEREREFNTRETRLNTQNAVKNDQGWQRLNQQRQQIEASITAKNANQQLAQWRAILDAEHKRAIEIIQSNSGFSALDPEEKKKLLKEQNDEYSKAIEAMRAKVGQSTPSGGTSETLGPKTQEQAPPGPAVPGQPTKVQTPEEAQKLAPGTKYVTPDGQLYTR